ncbi:MAG: TRAP transporter small permease [Pseudomonadota bacterium]
MFLRIINRAEEAIISILLVLTTLLVVMDVVMRFGFNKGFLWSQELTLNMGAWLVLFGASYGLKVGSHIGMDAFVKLFPAVGRRILTAIGVVLSLGYCYLILYGSWIYLAKVKKIGLEAEDLPIAVWILQSILFIGFLLLFIRLCIILWDVFTGKADSFKHADEAKESLQLVEIIKGEEK